MDIRDIRVRLRAGQFEFSRHAFRRVVERNISEAEIREAGATSEIIEDYPEDKYSQVVSFWALPKIVVPFISRYATVVWRR